jgi:multiple sugar transport system substrate-binding protein
MKKMAARFINWNDGITNPSTQEGQMKKGFGRRDALKALAAATIAGSSAMPPGLKAAQATDLRYVPEPGASLKVLRWKRFVQGDEDAWLANTRRFT